MICNSLISFYSFGCCTRGPQSIVKISREKLSQYIHLTSALRTFVCLPSKKSCVHIKRCDSFLLKFNFLFICKCHSHGLHKNYIYSQHFCNSPNKEDFKTQPVNVLPILAYRGYFKYDHGKRDKC